MSATKGRLVADLVRRKPCDRALTILMASSKRASRPIEKLIRSAISNAQEQNERHKAGIDLDSLYVKMITVDEGTRMWRIRPRAQGRANWIQKKTCHIRVELIEQ